VNLQSCIQEDEITYTSSPFVGWVDPAGVTMPTVEGDYRLITGSQAINVGNDSYYPTDTDSSVFDGITLSDAAKAAINAALQTDLAGKPRKQGAAIDIGAYEKE
jgi:hypothetical protein